MSTQTTIVATTSPVTTTTVVTVASRRCSLRFHLLPLPRGNQDYPTTVAAAKSNRNFFGFELEKEYCEIAEKD